MNALSNRGQWIIGTPLARHPHRVVVIGNLDGVHLGHQALMHTASEWAKDFEQSEIIALTFEPHPLAVLGAEAPMTLTGIRRKADLLKAHGLSVVVAMAFTREFAQLSPEEFVSKILVEQLGAACVVVGYDFRFGAKRLGTIENLRSLGQFYQFDVCVHEAVADDHGAYSSSRVRTALKEGDLSAAHAVLGRPHSVAGLVVEGAKRGRVLGFPTANVDSLEESLPRNGVYAVAVDLETSRTVRPLALGVANVGVRPTLPGAQASRSLEVHLFDLEEHQCNLYGASLRTHFVARLRDEMRFDNLDALRDQIARDAQAARALLQPFTRLLMKTSGGFSER